MKRLRLSVAAVLLASAAAAASPLLAQPIAWEHIGGEAFLFGLTFDEADTLWAINSRNVLHMPPGTEAWAEVSDYEGNRLMFTDAGSIIVETGGLARSTDRGRTFESVGQPAGGGLYRVRGGPLAGRLFAGVHVGNDPHGAAFSTDDGQTWIHAPIGDPDGPGGQAWAFAAVEDGPNAGRVVAACHNGLAYTDDGGLSWSVSSLWEPFAHIVYDVLRVPAGPHAGRLIASVGGEHDLWASEDDGATWGPLAELAPNADGVRFVWAGTTAAGPETVFAVSAYSDVWRSGDGGETWEGLGNVYPEATTYVKDALIGPDGRLYVAQHQAGSGDPSNGLYRTVAPVVSGEGGAPAPGATTLEVYPNPSAGRATAALALAETADVRVVVYDVLGRRVAVLHEGRLAAGAHRFGLDARALPAGIYVVRAESNTFTAARRVTVLR